MKPASARIRLLSRTALLCALLCILSVITLPIGAVPATLSLLGVFLCGLLLPTKNACLAVLGYLLLGAVGLPVFSSMQGGIGVLLGITGGYLWGYLPAVWVLSVLNTRLPRISSHRFLSEIGASCAALLVCYTCGTVQFLCLTNSTVTTALAVCVLPFLLPDLLKLAAARMLSRHFDRLL
ncbi:MAG: biotin transporter BioY [Ruminococcaceae bacterium]|nr:biotin transporter BioY [Oscillospiraceae bacterium]